MQYTIRQIPRQLDKALRAKAKAQKKSLNQVAVETLRRGLGLGPENQPKRDLSFMGKMDEQTAKAIGEAHEWFDRVWPEAPGK
jgi:plasmid stability protein